MTFTVIPKCRKKAAVFERGEEEQVESRRIRVLVRERGNECDKHTYLPVDLVTKRNDDCSRILC